MDILGSIIEITARTLIHTRQHFLLFNGEHLILSHGLGHKREDNNLLHC